MPKPQYGSAHNKARRTFKRNVVEPTWRSGNPLPCCLCGKPIAPWSPWDYDHVPGQPTLYRGASHPRCNRSDGAKRSPHAKRYKTKATKPKRLIL